jgi:hypothetical protein
MFAPVGRRDYDEARIRNSESLLHVLARAGVAVHWRDNQSGCKGVCSGLPSDTVEALKLPGLCGEGHCLDEGLLAGLEQRIAQAKGTQFIVLHMLGNHGPSYFRRYPPAFAKFQPACSHDDLRLCSREEIVNAYDNALLYTDHILARLVGLLRASASTVDAARHAAGDRACRANACAYGDVDVRRVRPHQRRGPRLPAPARHTARRARPHVPYAARPDGRAHGPLRAGVGPGRRVSRGPCQPAGTVTRRLHENGDQAHPRPADS